MMHNTARPCAFPRAASSGGDAGTCKSRERRVSSSRRDVVDVARCNEEARNRSIIPEAAFEAAGLAGDGVIEA